MIATHSAKTFNSKLKQSAVLASIIAKIPKKFLCSQNIKPEKLYFACPKNAADMKKTRAEIEALDENIKLENSIPAIEDTRLKQILLPYFDDYVSITPVSSLAVLHEVYNALRDNHAPFLKWTVQSTPAALANHGELMLMQGGRVRCFRRHYPSFDRKVFKETCVQLSCRVEGMNVSSGGIAVGLPAIAAIGGLAHVIERAVGFEIEFAVGVGRLSVKNTAIKIINHSTRKPISDSKSLSKPSLLSDEIKGSGEIAILLRPKNEHAALNCFKLIEKALSKIQKIGGGDIFYTEISILENEPPKKLKYLNDAYFNADNTLDFFIEKYKENGSWEDEKWRQSSLGYIPNCTGYAFLEEPVFKNCVRNNYKHAWAETLFSIVSQENISAKSFWQRKEENGVVFWKKTDRKMKRPHFENNDFAKKKET